MLNSRATAFLLGILLAAAPIIASAQDAGAPLPADSLIAAVIDPSLRTALAVPTFQVAAEIAGDKKQATVKLGFPMAAGWTAEAGFTGAFDHDLAASHPTSLRRLTDGSSAWGVTTWTKPIPALRPTAGQPGTQRMVPIVSARVEASRAAFDFYDLALARHTERHAASGVTVTAGLLMPADALVGVSYRWSEVWQVADERESCRFVADTAATVCPADRIFRRPAPQAGHQLEAQVQTRLGHKVGAEAFLTRDFRDRAWGLEVPVYFIARPDGGFTSGMVLTYNGHRDRFDVSVFVGQVFSLSK